MDTIDIAKQSIENFSIDETLYSEVNEFKKINVKGNGRIFVKDLKIAANISIDFRDSSGCKVFLGSNLRGNITIFFNGDNSLLYIGNNCFLKKLDIRSFQPDDFIAIGSGVTTTSTNTWISGKTAGSAKPAIIIGDDCMFSYDIVIRNSDAHPIFNVDTDDQLNEPKGIVHIEPHVWIAERVSILKSVTIGACSILGFGSIITKDVPRFSVATGIPAVSKQKPDIYWARNTNENAKKRAKYFHEKYKNT